MKRMLTGLHAKLGDLWWYTLLLFVAQRFGDVINMFVGLWLVPRLVPQNELGAVMPLAQVISFVGLPLVVISSPFMKFLNRYAERGEFGKVKALLRDVFVGTGIMAIVTLFVAWVSLPFFFARLRVPVGSLAILVVISSLLGSVSTIFQNAVQGLKLFSPLVWFSAIGAPLRLAVMLVAMPFRALAGYFVGQSATPSLNILGSIWVLCRRLDPAIRPQPYWKEDRGIILRYMIPTAILAIITTCGSSVDQLIIRHRLTDFESAGFYMISRFAEIASYLGIVFTTFLFPMVASKGAKDKDSLKILKHSIWGTFAGGIAVSALLFWGGEFLLGLQPHWKEYQSLSGCMALMAFYNTLVMVSSCMSTYEGAQGRFRFLWYTIPIVVVKALLLYALTSYAYFKGIIPDSVIVWIEEFNPNRLLFVVRAFIAFTVIMLLCQTVDVFGCHRWRDR